MSSEEFEKAMQGFEFEVPDDAFSVINSCTYVRVRGCRNDVLRLQRRMNRLVERERRDYGMVSTDHLAEEYGIRLKGQGEWGILFYCEEISPEDYGGVGSYSFWFEIGTVDRPCYELLDQLAREAAVDFYYYFANSATEYYETNDPQERGIFGNFLVFEQESLGTFTSYGGAAGLLRKYYDDEQSLSEAVLELGASDYFETQKGGKYCHIYYLDAFGYGAVEGYDMEYSDLPRDPDDDAYETEWLVSGNGKAPKKLLGMILEGMEKFGRVSLRALADRCGMEPEKVAADTCADASFAEGRIVFCEKNVAERHGTYSFIVSSPVVNYAFMERLSEQLGVCISSVVSYETQSGRRIRIPSEDPVVNAMTRRTYSHYWVKADTPARNLCSYLDAKYVINRYVVFDWTLIADLDCGESYTVCEENEKVCVVTGWGVK